MAEGKEQGKKPKKPDEKQARGGIEVPWTVW
jgi:hypothetical protein